MFAPVPSGVTCSAIFPSLSLLRGIKRKKTLPRNRRDRDTKSVDGNTRVSDESRDRGKVERRVAINSADQGKKLNGSFALVLRPVGTQWRMGGEVANIEVVTPGHRIQRVEQSADGMSSVRWPPRQLLNRIKRNSNATVIIRSRSPYCRKPERGAARFIARIDFVIPFAAVKQGEPGLISYPDTPDRVIKAALAAALLFARLRNC